MAFQYEFRPIEKWPGEFTKERRVSPFRSPYTKTLQLLESELRHLNASSVVIQADFDASMIRRDGMLRSDARLRGPAVILSFDSKHGPLCYPADRFTHWDCNLRAIALSLQALRSVDRYGVTRRAEQYRGWERIAQQPARVDMVKAAEILEVFSEVKATDILSSRQTLDAAFRAASFNTHPDRGGSVENFKKVQAAYELLKVSIAA